LSYDEDTLIHLHDWHTGFLFLLKGLHPSFSRLKKYRVVFTIHNLFYQGSRPVRGGKASVEAWFPELFSDVKWIEDWRDRRYASPTFTPMAAGIKFADMINTVSPTYAEEILIPSDPERGFYGGEGLETLLREARQKGRLTGILNGIDYTDDPGVSKTEFSGLLDIIKSEVLAYNESHPPGLPGVVLERISKMKSDLPVPVITSVTRVSDQKIRLLFEKGTGGRAALDMILDALREYNGFYIFIGNGEPKYEALFEQRAVSDDRFLYLKLYSDVIARSLYANGTMFLMPSSFEPCGLTQMIAMRNGQPCVVHATGGLKDTVIDGINGFQFKGSSIIEQTDGLISSVKRALRLYAADKYRWYRICSEARNARFEWKISAEKYIKEVYSPP